MKQRLGVIVGILAAFLVGAFAVTATASAADAGAVKLQKQVKKAKKKSKATCKKVKKAKGKKAKKKAKKRCAKSKKNVKKAQKKLTTYNKAQYFDVCQHGCKYRTVQNGSDAAGKWQLKTKRKATVRVQPGTYVEGVFLDGRNPSYDYDGLTIMGVTKAKKPAKDASQVILEGQNAKTIVDGTPQVANNAIEGRSIVGLKMENMYARHYQNNTFFVWADPAASLPGGGKERCADYTMNNLMSSDTRSYGFFARNCFGGTIENSDGWNHGDSAVYIGQTPCDSPDWTNHGANPAPCQAHPDWTVINNVKSHQNVLGYSGTNSKYVEIENSSFYNNGAGIVPNTLDSEKFEPNGWTKIHDNNIFWNNYNYFSTGSEFKTVSDGLGKVLGQTVNYPMGAGVVLFGSDGIDVYDNNIFGNEKWGAMTFSAPVVGDSVVANEGDDAKNLNNSFRNNKMGRNGLDPNGTDFLNDATGGGNCFSGNTGSPAVTYVLGNGSVPQATLYPACPVNKVTNDSVPSYNFEAGIQYNLDNDLDPDTILGYVAADPPKTQECSWTKGTPHAAFTDASGYSYTEKRADPVTCPTE